MATKNNNIFSNLHAKAGDQDRSIQWYMKNVKALVGNNVTSNAVMKSEIGRLETKIEIGSMYLYFYDPKTKDKLPFYDTFPLVFPFKPAPGGFYGINLHYLPYMLRAKVLGELLNYTDQNLTETSKIKMSYGFLQGLASTNELMPCVKRYLTTHVRSSFMKINPKDWKATIFLPVEGFIGASKDVVFRNTRSKIK
jgi:hypothetical protein